MIKKQVKILVVEVGFYYQDPNEIPEQDEQEILEAVGRGIDKMGYCVTDHKWEIREVEMNGI